MIVGRALTLLVFSSLLAEKILTKIVLNLCPLLCNHCILRVIAPSILGQSILSANEEEGYKLRGQWLWVHKQPVILQRIKRQAKN